TRRGRGPDRNKTGHRERNPCRRAPDRSARCRGRAGSCHFRTGAGPRARAASRTCVFRAGVRAPGHAGQGTQGACRCRPRTRPPRRRSRGRGPARRADPASSAPVPAPRATPGKARRAPADADRERARRAAEAEAAALREMMRQPRKVLRAPEPEETPTTGTLHKPAGTKASVKKESEGKKVIKAADVSSSWSNDGRKKPSKADTLSAGSGRDAWRAGGKAGSRGSKGARC